MSGDIHPRKAPRVAVVQDGARLHYAVPVVLDGEHALARMYSPWYVKRRSLTALAAWAATKLNPDKGRRMRERQHPALPEGLIYTRPAMALSLARRRKNFGPVEDFYAWESDQVGRWISSLGFGDANTLFGFVRNISPTLCAQARDAGLLVVVDQMIATMVEERRQMVIQAERFPEWVTATEPTNHEIVQRVERETWQAASCVGPATTKGLVTCASEYVKSSLIEQGISPENIEVLPYPIDAGKFAVVDRRNRPGVTVGFVGGLGLRKGTPYFLQIARKFAHNPSVKFVLVGPGMGGQTNPLFSQHSNVQVVGAVPRSQVADWLAKFDILLFPSTCEGSPGAVMEAMATGLPVVSTPTSGTVIRDRTDGFLRAYDDIDGLAAALEALIANSSLREHMATSARQRVESFNLPWYGRALTQAIAARLSPHPTA